LVNNHLLIIFYKEYQIKRKGSLDSGSWAGMTEKKKGGAGFRLVNRNDGEEKRRMQGVGLEFV